MQADTPSDENAREEEGKEDEEGEKEEEDEEEEEEKEKEEENDSNKAVYTTTSVAGGWAGAVMSWAGAVLIWGGACSNTNFPTIKKPKNPKKAKCERPTDQRTNGQTG